MVKGSLIGDPLDIKMFEATDWMIEDDSTKINQFDELIIAVIKPKTNHANNNNNNINNNNSTNNQISVVK